MNNVVLYMGKQKLRKAALLIQGHIAGKRVCVCVCVCVFIYFFYIVLEHIANWVSLVAQTVKNPPAIETWV